MRGRDDCEVCGSSHCEQTYQRLTAELAEAKRESAGRKHNHDELLGDLIETQAERNALKAAVTGADLCLTETRRERDALKARCEQLESDMACRNELRYHLARLESERDQARAEVATIKVELASETARADSERTQRQLLSKRVSDLKFAMGDDVGWFDRCQASSQRAAQLEAALRVAREALETTISRCVAMRDRLRKKP